MRLQRSIDEMETIGIRPRNSFACPNLCNDANVEGFTRMSGHKMDLQGALLLVRLVTNFAIKSCVWIHLFGWCTNGLVWSTNVVLLCAYPLEAVVVAEMINHVTVLGTDAIADNSLFAREALLHAFDNH